MGCTSPSQHNGELVMMNCNIQKDGLPNFTATGDFSSLQYEGTGLRVKAEMYQCVEISHSETKKDKVGGGTTTITTYTYQTEWKSEPVSSAAFHEKGSDNFRQNCGTENPAWPREVPRTGSQYAQTVTVGAVKTSLTQSIPLDTPITNVAAPYQWSKSSSTFTSSKWRQASNGIGNVQVSFYGNDWANPQATLLGMNANGRITAWTAPDSWLCSGFQMTELRMGTFSKDQLFDVLEKEHYTTTWIIRIVGFALLWLAFSLLFGPLEVLADCIPCIGPCLGDSIAAVTCCISCLPATACCSLVVGVVWVVMRPLVGVPLLLLSAAVVVGFIIFKMNAKKLQGSPSSGLGSPAPQYGTAQLAVPVGTPVAVQPARQMQVQVPVGCVPGSTVQVTTPEGVLMNVIVPIGCVEGSIFLVSY